MTPVRPGLKISNVDEAVFGLSSEGGAVSHKSLLRTDSLETGVIEFRPVKREDEGYIVHQDKEVLCLVLDGEGVLRRESQTDMVHKGDLCHIPKGVRHDFRAGKNRLLLFYLLVKT